MTKITYGELLKDPRWQKKRLEIFNRDKWACQTCSSKDKTLNVHHFSYESGALPWEYPDDNFCTLCEGCHKLETELRTNEYFRVYSIKAKIPAITLWYGMASMAYLFSKDQKKFLELYGTISKEVGEFDSEEFFKFIRTEQ